MIATQTAGPAKENHAMNPLQVGQAVQFEEDPNPFTVQAVSADGRWVAATRGWCQWDIDQAHLRGDDEYYEWNSWPEIGDCIYTVFDLRESLRGVDNAVGSLGYENSKDCEAAVAMFESGQFEFSHRAQPIPLRIRSGCG